MEDAIILALYAQAEKHFPNEACGFILEDNGLLTLIECENVAAEPAKAFKIPIKDYIQYKDRIAYTYHTHPNQLATPSEADIRASQRTNLPYLILGWPGKDISTYTPKDSNRLPYVGRPFIYGVLDCLSLVSDYYLQEFKITLPEPSRKSWGWWQEIEHINSFIDGFVNAGFSKVPALRPGDVIIMQLAAKCPNHSAIYLGNNVILHHATSGSLSKEEMYGHYWKENTVCFLRHNEVI